MKTIKPQLTLALVAFTLPNLVHANLFADTPLQHAYQALATNQPLLAWQELNLALNQHTITREHWQPIKREILRQTACGTALPLDVNLDTKLRLSFIKRSGLASQGYQVRLSTEASLANQEVSLMSPDGVVLLKGSFAANFQYQEVESAELLKKPTSGVFTLSVGGKKTTLLLAMDSDNSWLTQSQKPNQPQVTLKLPTHIAGCPVAVASWQWFDKNYNMLGSKVPFQYAQENAPATPPIASKASYLSASVELVEFQQGIRIEYIQRLAIPYQ